MSHLLRYSNTTLEVLEENLIRCIKIPLTLIHTYENFFKLAMVYSNILFYCLLIISLDPNSHSL